MSANVARVGDLRIAYERRGDGPPLIMLPGYVGDGPGTFRFQLESLSDGFTVVAWDPPGSGLSSDPPQGFRLADYADVLAGFVQALGYSRVHTLASPSVRASPSSSTDGSRRCRHRSSS